MGHASRVDVATAQRAATSAGLITAPLGVVLVAFPGVAAVAGLDARTTLVIGATDLALAAGFLAGRPRWPWTAARAAANLPTAFACLRTGSPIGRLAVGLAVLTVIDGAAAAALRTSSR
jgi:hypothetical protein